MNEMDRITVNPRVMGGRPCVRGLGMPVSQVLAMIAPGEDEDTILANHPDLEPEEIRQSLQYAAKLSDDAIDKLSIIDDRLAKVDRVSSARVDRRVFEFGTLDDDNELEYWHSRTPDERLEAAELLRQINYGDAAITGRLQRVFEIAEFGTKWDST